MRKLILVAVLVSACGGAGAGTEPPTTGSPPTPATTSGSSETTVAPPPPTSAPGPPRLDHFLTEESYGPDIVEIYGPPERGPWPVLVLFHGGGWVTGSPADTARLANELAARGVVVYNASYRTMNEGGAFPQMVEDVACALSFAGSTAATYTTTPEALATGGHSAGAHLSLLAALAPETFTGDCEYGPVAVEGFVGLAGPYDTDRLATLIAPLFGASLADAPERWAAGNPLTYVATSPDIDYLIIHGSEDELVPVALSEELAAALEGAGRRVSLEIIDGETHGGVAEPVVVNDLIVEFLESLP
jgi:acetyl esterase/lipase